MRGTTGLKKEQTIDYRLQTIDYRLKSKVRKDWTAQKDPEKPEKMRQI